jgi:hypothetical protein
MCGGVKYRQDGEEHTVYFPQPKACLPVRLKTGSARLVTWGRRREEDCILPPGGWARLDSVRAGKWQRYGPRPVLIGVESFMEKDDNGNSHWYDLAAGDYIQGLVAWDGEAERVYVVTVTPELPEHMAVHDRWPRIVSRAESP